MQRRTALRLACRMALMPALAAGTTLVGCGFALRNSARLPFRTITLSGFAANSPLATELARALEDQGVSVVETTAQALALGAAKAPAEPTNALPDLSGHVIFEALTDGRQQVVASSTAFGQVRDLTLRTRLEFQVLRADGSVLLPRTDLLLSRDLTYNEKDALAKQNESEALHKAMQSDIVAQVLRRLSAIKPDRLSER